MAKRIAVNPGGSFLGKKEWVFGDMKMVRGPNPTCKVCGAYMDIYYLDSVTFRCRNCRAVFVIPGKLKRVKK
jgi:tRNA(Ile2) C34 agmatinyltransferase TiaS